MERDTAWGCLGFPGASAFPGERHPRMGVGAKPTQEPQSPDDLDVNLCLSRHLI